MSARAALDAARAVFSPSQDSSASRAPAYVPWRATSVTLETAQERGDAMWVAAEQVLQAAIGGSDIAGQALVGAARQQHVLSLSDAFALAALQGWVDRLRDPSQSGVARATSPSETERSVARDAWIALEHAARPVAPVPPVSLSPATPDEPSLHGGQTEFARTAVAEAAPGVPDAPPPLNQWQEQVTSPRRRWSSTVRRLVWRLVWLGVLSGAAVGGYWRVGAGSRDWKAAVIAYENGATDSARLYLTRYADAHPDDARPLVYLGRIAREQQDMARSKRMLESALRLDPNSAMAQREMGSALLATNEPELARRFYVRALQRDPTDRPAQGFLGCALARLGRADEARRWIERAGPGDWSWCAAALSPPGVPAPPMRSR